MCFAHCKSDIWIAHHQCSIIGWGQKKKHRYLAIIKKTSEVLYLSGCDMYKFRSRIYSLELVNNKVSIKITHSIRQMQSLQANGFKYVRHIFINVHRKCLDKFSLISWLSSIILTTSSTKFLQSLLFSSKNIKITVSMKSTKIITSWCGEVLKWWGLRC